MGRRVYRICLLSMIILAVLGGIFYYLNFVEDQSRITEGTLVEQDWRDENMLQAGMASLPIQVKAEVFYE